MKDGIITFRTQKTGQVVTLPILPQLAATVAASPTGNLAFITGERGRPMVKEGFGNWFRDACNAAGVTGSVQGSRKLGATRAASDGATEAQIEAIFGWPGGSMASPYTRQANRRRLAMGAMDKMVPKGKIGRPYSRTQGKVRASSRKHEQ